MKRVDGEGDSAPESVPEENTHVEKEIHAETCKNSADLEPKRHMDEAKERSVGGAWRASHDRGLGIISKLWRPLMLGNWHDQV